MILVFLVVLGCGGYIVFVAGMMVVMVAAVLFHQATHTFSNLNKIASWKSIQVLQ